MELLSLDLIAISTITRFSKFSELFVFHNTEETDHRSSFTEISFVFTVNEGMQPFVYEKIQDVSLLPPTVMLLLILLMLRNGQVFLFSANITFFSFNLEAYLDILLICISIILRIGGGSMVGAIGGSTQREPHVVGKPSTFMMDYLAKEYVTQPRLL